MLENNKVNVDYVITTSVLRKSPVYGDSPIKTCEAWIAAKQRVDEAEGLWRIKDELYDLNDFIPHHPGGSFWLENTKGTDITEAFESHHISTKPEGMLNKFHVCGTSKPRNYKFTLQENGFYKVLKSRVRNKLKDLDYRPARRSDLIHFGLLLSTLICAMASSYTGYIIFVLFGGLSLCWLTVVAHNYLHRKDNWQMYTFNLSLMNYCSWRISHAMSHHVYTNSVHDLEILMFEPFLCWRPSSTSHKKWIRRFSVTIQPIVYAILFPVHILLRQLAAGDTTLRTYAEMKENITLIFCNSHFSEGPIRPLVPGIVEIGGIQIKDKPDPLPRNIADFLNASKENGAILFSLGSNMKSSNVQPSTVQAIYKVLSSLKQNVIWKWEDPKTTPGDAKNILYQSWIPQDDILAHPNLCLFITHAGKGGMVEATYHGVPMVAMPIFAEQPTNAAKIVDSGYGLQVDIINLNENVFRDAILEVLNNPVYRNNIRKFAQLYRDRPLSAKESVVYWVEYVLRYNGGAHMQSTVIHMNWLQSNNLDVYVIFIFTLYVIKRLLKCALKASSKLIHLVRRQIKPRQSSKSKNE